MKKGGDNNGFRKYTLGQKCARIMYLLINTTIRSKNKLDISSIMRVHNI